MGESHVRNLQLLLLCFLHSSSIPQSELSLKPHNLNCFGSLLVTVCLDRIFVLSSMLDHLTPPMGQVDQNVTFLKNSILRGFVKMLFLLLFFFFYILLLLFYIFLFYLFFILFYLLFLILPRICSQKIKDSQSILKIVQSSWFLLHEAKKKGGSLYPTFPYS